MKRRFIAGAVCPACKALDKIVMETHEGDARFRECVACGFREPLDTAPHDGATGGRFERRAPADPDSAHTPVRIVDTKPPHC